MNYNKKTVKDVDVRGRKVLLRCDFNVPLDMTAHTTNLVPFILCGAGSELRKGGKLADIAPTILDVMGLQCPPEMTGTTLIIK